MTTVLTGMQPRVTNDYNINKKQNESATWIFPDVKHVILAYLAFKVLVTW